jgi:hypothetical protein
MRSRHRIFGVVLALLTVSATAFADEEPEPNKVDPRARAQQLFDSALTDAEAGNFAAACPKFLASQEADPKTSTLLNLANCYEKNGQTASAWGAFREAEGLARKAARADWESSARARAEAIEPKLLRLSILVPPPNRIGGLVVTRDGARLAPGEWGVAIPVDPGEHVVTASAEGRVPWESRVVVEAGEGKSPNIEVQVPPLERVPAPPPPPSAPVTPVASGWSTMETTGVILAGVGGVGLITGGILGLVAQSTYDDARSRCTDPPRGCPADAVSDSDGAYGLATGATVALIVGAALVVGGGSLYLFSPRGTEPTRPTARLGVRPSGFALTW